jgi:hypothetical protein
MEEKEIDEVILLTAICLFDRWEIGREIRTEC